MTGAFFNSPLPSFSAPPTSSALWLSLLYSALLHHLLNVKCHHMSSLLSCVAAPQRNIVTLVHINDAPSSLNKNMFTLETIQQLKQPVGPSVSHSLSQSSSQVARSTHRNQSHGSSGCITHTTSLCTQRHTNTHIIKTWLSKCSAFQGLAACWEIHIFTERGK